MDAEIAKQRIQLMETPQYQQYIESRQKAYEGFAEYAEHAQNADPGLNRWNSESLEKYLDAIIGPNPVD